jgi:hypothetical protein
MEAADVREDIEHLFAPTMGLGLNEAALEALRDCKHKLYGVRFHVDSLNKEIADQESKIRAAPPPPAGAGWTASNPRIVYHFEALVFQTKSTLDMLVGALKLAYPSLRNMSGFNHSGEADQRKVGGKTIRAIRGDSQRLSDEFEAARQSWIQYAVDLRDRVAHKSRLRNLTSFIQEAHEGGGQVTIRYPTIPSGMRVDEYGEAIYAKLTELLQTVLRESRGRFQAQCGVSPAT